MMKKKLVLTAAVIAALSVVSSLLPHAAKETTMLVASNTLNTFFFIENFLPFFFPHFCVSEPFYRLLCICAILLLFRILYCYLFCVLLCSAFVFCCVSLFAQSVVRWFKYSTQLFLCQCAWFIINMFVFCLFSPNHFVIFLSYSFHFQLLCNR